MIINIIIWSFGHKLYDQIAILYDHISKILYDEQSSMIIITYHAMQPEDHSMKSKPKDIKRRQPQAPTSKHLAPN